MAFIDYEKAFDTIQHWTIIEEFNNIQHWAIIEEFNNTNRLPKQIKYPKNMEEL